METTLLWWQNHPSNFLATLDDAKREEIHREARAHLPMLRAAAKQRRVELQARLEQKLKEKHAKREHQEQKAINTKLKASREISRFGGPWTLSEVTAQLAKLDENTSRLALMCQLRFHLCEVLSLNDCDAEEDTPASSLVYKSSTTFDQDIVHKKRDVVKRLEKGRKLRQAQQAREHLPSLEADPLSLVARRILHQCSEDGAAPQWYPAVVEGVSQMSTNPYRVSFSVKYDGEAESYDFPLLVDLKKGDLILL